MTSWAKDGDFKQTGRGRTERRAAGVFNFSLHAHATGRGAARQPRFVCRYQDCLGMGWAWEGARERKGQRRRLPTDRPPAPRLSEFQEGEANLSRGRPRQAKPISQQLAKATALTLIMRLTSAQAHLV